MKAIKRVLPLFLAIVLSLACVVVVSAKTFPDVNKYDDNYEAIDLLSELKVIEGHTDGTFKPDTDITRWQMALLMSKLLTGDVNQANWKDSKNTTTFTDINFDQYLGSINYANTKGIVKGRSTTVFDPTAGISLQEGVTMAVRALGYPSSSLDAGYPESYLTLAKKIGLMDGLSEINATATLTRGQTARLFYNMLFTAKYSRTNEVSYIAIDTFKLGDTYVLIATENDSIIGDAKASKDSVLFYKLNENGTYGKSMEMKISALGLNYSESYFANLLGNSFTFLYNNETLLKFVQNSKSTVLTDASVSVNNDNRTLKIGNGNTAYAPVSSFSSTSNTSTKEIIIYSTNTAYATSLKNVGKTALGISDIKGTTDKFDMTLFDDNGDGYYDRAIYNPYTFGKYVTTDIIGYSSLVSMAGVKVVDIRAADISFSGYSSVSNVPDNSYVLYTYNPITEKAKVVYVAAAETEAEIKSYTYNSTTIKIGNNTYYLGAGIIDASTETVIKDIERYTNYEGVDVKFVAYGTKILYIEIGDNLSYSASVSKNDLYVVKSIDLTGLSQTTPSISVTLVGSDGRETSAYTIYRLNNTSVSQKNCDLYVNDVVELTEFSSAGQIYNGLTRVESSPAYVNQESTKRLMHINDPIDTSKEYLILASLDEIVIKIPVNVGTTKIYYADEDRLVDVTDDYTAVISAGTAIYYTTKDSPNNKYATFIIIKEFVANDDRSKVNDFDTIAYINTSSLRQTGGAYQYVAFDFITGTDFYVTCTTRLSNSGIYLIKGSSVVLSTPVTYNVTNNSNIEFDKEFVVSSSIPSGDNSSITFAYYENGTKKSTTISTADILYYKITAGAPVRQTNIALSDLAWIGIDGKAKAFSLMTITYAGNTKYIFIA